MAALPTFDEAAWDAAIFLVDEASALVDAGALEAARARAALAARRLAAIVGAGHPDHAQALVIEGDALAGLGRLAVAGERYRRAAAILDAYRDGPDAALVRPFRVALLGRLGHHQALCGRFAAAEACLHEALALAIEDDPGDAAGPADLWNTLGVVLRFAGRFDEAGEAYRKAGALRGAAGLDLPPAYLHNLAGLAVARGDHAAGERHARAAAALRRAREGAGFGLGTDLCGLADALAGLGRPADAEPLYREGLDLYRRAGRGDHPEAAYALHNLGDTLAALGRAAPAEAAYLEALDLLRKSFGDEHPELAATLANLAALQRDLGRVEAARRTSEDALAIARATLPPGHPVRAGVEALGRALDAAAG